MIKIKEKEKDRENRDKNKIYISRLHEIKIYNFLNLLKQKENKYIMHLKK